MDFSVIMQYISYLLVAIGVMAFVVSAVTQVVKSWPGLDKLPTSVVVIVLSLVLCPVTFVALMAWMDREITWYMVFACMIGAFIVALVAMAPLIAIQIMGLVYTQKSKKAIPSAQPQLDEEMVDFEEES